jgi:hypothetical protein
VAEDKVRQDRNVEIAKNFIVMGLDNVTIANGTGLTVDQIENLRSEKD